VSREGALEGRWWGEFEFAPGDVKLWRLGTYALWAERTGTEFRLASRRDEESSESLAVALPVPSVPDDVTRTRYGVREAAHSLRLSPATADRAVVVKSRDPFIVPPGGAVTVFVSSPVWVQVALTDPHRPLQEEPVRRPSDTWFGPDTMTGDLGYAVRTSVRYDLAHVPAEPHRVVSVARIRNQAGTPLPLARMRLPLPYLSLFADREGRLWTEAVSLDRNDDDDLAEIKLGRSAPREAGPCERVAEPRESMTASPIFRSFAGLLGLRTSREAYERVVE